MTEIASFEAKTHFSDLLRRVTRKGERFVVTVRGKPAAMLCPLEGGAHTEESIETLLEGLRAFRSTLKPITNTGESLKDLAREGLE